MYRQNKLKEELDKLRKENERLLLENVYLKERNNTLQSELYNIRLEIQNKSLCDSLQKELLTKPRVIRVDKDSWNE